MMREKIYIMVADYCLIEAIKKFNDSGCDGIELGKVGDNWLVSYYKEPVECYQDAMSHSNQDDELEYNELKKNWKINEKPNPYMPYEYYSTQLKSAAENNDLVHVPVAGTISAELYNIIKDRLKNGIEYHECDGTRIDKKEYETLYNIIGHTYDDAGDNAESSDFRLPNAKGWCIRIK